MAQTDNFQGGNQTNLIDSDLVAEVWTDALPSADPVLYGHVDLDPKGSFEARSPQTFTLTYTVGRHGIDDTGSIRVLFRSVGDSGRLQTTDPTKSGYVTARASNGTGLTTEYRTRGGTRPRNKCVEVFVSKGCLREGDQIIITFGDRTGGGPGMLMQTHCESNFEFKVAADVCATGHWVPIPNSPSVAIIPGPVHIWRAVLPTLRRPGETFQLGLKAEDKWGNPTHLAETKLKIVSNLAVDGLPETVDYPRGERAITIEGLSVKEPGELNLHLEDEAGQILAHAAPLVIREDKHGGYWADLHGQSGESIGIGTSREYFDFARNCSFLDATSHQANDFQVNNAFWALINELTAEHHKDHRFVTFPGYEWSGNTAVGGDRNVFFREEGRQIRRSSHALLPDRSDIHTDANDAGKLFEALKDEDCVIFAHVGGRYADIGFAHDGRLEKSMELHSAWGTFEWLIEDCFDLGHRVGVVCNSDGHKGRPGSSYPGASTFGAYGGLTCFYARELTRDGIFESLRKRRHYGTTGNRLHLEVNAEFQSGGQYFEQDPAIYDVEPSAVSSVMMGDIATTKDKTVTLRVKASSATPIERIEVRNGRTVVETKRGFSAGELGERIRVLWGGAEYRGRGRETFWKGDVTFNGRSIDRLGKINAWNLERRLEVVGEDKVAFDAITTGNFGGFDAWLKPGDGGTLSVDTGHVTGEIKLDDIGIDYTVLDAGGLRRQIKACRLPEENAHKELEFTVEVDLDAAKDNPLWVSVYTEDGFQAWSSPIYLIPG